MKNINCIIIDDDSTSIMILKNLCSSNGHLNVIAEFSNVQDALIYLREQKVDLILLDIHMEELSGFELIDCLKSFNLSILPQIVIVTMDDKCAFKGFEYNCTDYLLKPIELLRFNKAISKVRKKHKLYDFIEINAREIY